MKITAVAVASIDKAEWAFYERRVRPPEQVHPEWIDHNDQHVMGGLRWLDDQALEVPHDGWLARGERLSQADISAVVAFTFASAVRPHLKLAEEVPALASLAARCEAMPIFQRAPLPESVS
jgi:glutathione S-transferase